MVTSGGSVGACKATGPVSRGGCRSGSVAASMGGRVAVLVSGSGTNLQALLDDPAVRPSHRPGPVRSPGVRALERADARPGVETLVIEPEVPIAARYDRGRARRSCSTRGIDMIVSAGYMRVLGAPVRRRVRRAGG